MISHLGRRFSHHVPADVPVPELGGVLWGQRGRFSVAVGPEDCRAIIRGDLTHIGGQDGPCPHTDQVDHCPRRVEQNVPLVHGTRGGWVPGKSPVHPAWQCPNQRNEHERLKKKKKKKGGEKKGKKKAGGSRSMGKALKAL